MERNGNVRCENNYGLLTLLARLFRFVRMPALRESRSLLFHPSDRPFFISLARTCIRIHACMHAHAEMGSEIWRDHLLKAHQMGLVAEETINNAFRRGCVGVLGACVRACGRAQGVRVCVRACERGWVCACVW